MIELVFLALSVIAGTYGVFLVIRFVLPILRLIFTSTLNIVFLLAHILLIIILVQTALLIGIYPFFKSYFIWLNFSMLQLVTVIAVISISALFLVIKFGKSSAFRQYGTLAVSINGLTTVFIILSLYSLSKKNVANFGLAKLHFSEAVFTLSIYLTSINISTYLFYGYDKIRAWLFPKSRDSEPPLLNHWVQKLAHRIEKFTPWIKTSRVPEWILHWHSICGGSLGALIAQGFFNHKTKKGTFQAVYRKIVIAQMALLIATFFLIKSNTISSPYTTQIQHKIW